MYQKGISYQSFFPGGNITVYIAFLIKSPMYPSNDMQIFLRLQDLQDDMEDMLDQANEVQEALGRQYGMPELDDADLDAGELFSYNKTVFCFYETKNKDILHQ